MPRGPGVWGRRLAPVGFWSSLFRRREPPARPAPRPRPADWNKGLDALMAESRRTISGEEIEWARSYDRDRLRAWARFPRDGEVHEATGGVEVTYQVHWKAPYTGGGKAVLPAGTRVRVSLFEHDPEPVGVYATPLDDGALERQLVPEIDRSSRKYGGFSLFVDTEVLNRHFRLAPE